MKKTVRFYKPLLVERDETVTDVPDGFWDGALQRVSSASAEDRRVWIGDAPWFGDAGQGRSRTYPYLRSGRIRRAAEWPAVVDDDGNVGPLALAEGNLFESAYIVPFGAQQRVAMVGPLRGTASRSGLESWLAAVLGLPRQGRSIRLEPLVDEALAEKLARSVGVSRLEVVVPAGVQLDLPDGPASEVERALASAGEAAGGDLDVTLAWSHGSRRKGERVGVLLDAAKRLWGVEGLKRLQVSLMLPLGDGKVLTEVHELVEDRITVQADFAVDANAQPDTELMLEGMHRAIVKYQRPGNA